MPMARPSPVRPRLLALTNFRYRRCDELSLVNGCTGIQATVSPKPSGRRRSSHPGITEQHGFKVLRITADIHLLEVIVPTRRRDLPLKFALKLDIRHTIDTKEIIRSTTIGLGRVHAIGNDVDAGGLQTFDRFDYFLREIGSLAIRAFGPGGTVIIKLDKDLLHNAHLSEELRFDTTGYRQLRRRIGPATGHRICRQEPDRP